MAELVKTLSRRRLVAGAGIVCAAALLGRIACVNATAPFDIAVIHHPIGEQIDLDGAFLVQAEFEQTRGYLLRVTNAELISRNEFVRRYSTFTTKALEGCEVPSIVCVELEMVNEGSAGKLNLLEMMLIPERKNAQLVYDPTLYVLSEEKLQGTPFMGKISIRQNTTYVTHVPYCLRSAQSFVDGVPSQEAWYEPLPDRRFEMRLTNLPVRHVVDIAV